MTSSTRNIMKGLLGMSLLCACSGSPCLSGYSHVDINSWYADDTVVMNVQSADTSLHQAVETVMDMRVGVRFTEQYKYRNLALEVQLICDGTLAKRDTVLFETYNDKDKANGRGLLYHDMEKNLSSVSIDPSRKYDVRIRHIMRQNPLSGISEVSVVLE